MSTVPLVKSERAKLSVAKIMHSKLLTFDTTSETIKYPKIKDRKIGRVIFKQYLDKANQYLQFRISMAITQPQIIFGLVTEHFKVEEDISRQTEIWCFNINSGDKFSNQKWKEYFDTDVVRHQAWDDSDDQGTTKDTRE